MYNLIIIVICFILTIFIYFRVKNRQPEIEIIPADSMESSRTGFPLPWISKTASTVKAQILIHSKRTTVPERITLLFAAIGTFCSLVDLFFNHGQQIVSFFGSMFT